MESKHDDAYSETTEGTKERVDTPTHSTCSWDDNRTSYDDEIGPLSVPWPGSTYMIRHRDSGKAITMGINGLRLEPIKLMGGGWHWICVEKDGWLGFRNYVSGMYMGHDNSGGIYARNDQHRTWEFFVAKANPRGGYELLTIHGWKFKKMGVAKKGGMLIEMDGEGALWDFVKVPV